MKSMKIVNFILLVTLIAMSFSCESEESKQQRLLRAEERRLEQLKREEKEREQKQIFEQYKENSLQTGATPYAMCYGINRYCDTYGCSEIEVRTPSSSDVLVTIKSGGEVVRHAYIKANSSFKFELPNGTYQPFFYYGKGWNPEKVMKSNSGCKIKGGFLTDEVFGKDDPQYLHNSILSYELILQKNGNFSTRPSNANEAL